MIIKIRLTEKDYINVSFLLWFKRPYIKIIYGVLMICILISILGGDFLEQDFYSDFLIPIVALAILPAFTYLAAKRNYAANPRIKENIEYKFEKDYLFVEGESFKSQLSWDKIYKVTQTKNWVLIWRNRQVANAIPKEDIWEGERAELKNILSAHKIKNNL